MCKDIQPIKVSLNFLKCWIKIQRHTNSVPYVLTEHQGMEDFFFGKLAAAY